MKEPGERLRYYETLPYRVLTGALGIALVGGGLYGVSIAGLQSAWAMLIAAALVVLGANMVWSAWAARESWLSRIGPLP
jgi:hypothetical protein